MNMVRDRLIHSGLKITPQRIAIFNSVIRLNNHPTVEQIADDIREDYPNISIATIYKVLDTLVDNGLLKRVTTEKDVSRYDAIVEPHHHIYISDSKIIKDYFDSELSDLLISYFSKKEIPGIAIEDIKLQIIGRSK